MTKKNKFNFKRIFLFKLKPTKINKTKLLLYAKNKKNAFIYLSLNENIKDKEYIKDFMVDYSDLIIRIDRVDFKNWFNDKNKYQKYIFLNNNMHVKHEYRWIRDQGYLSYLIN